MKVLFLQMNSPNRIKHCVLECQNTLLNAVLSGLAHFTEINSNDVFQFRVSLLLIKNNGTYFKFTFYYISGEN
jgi:hypothetical protein